MKNDNEPRKKTGARAIALLAIALGAALLSCNNPFWSQSARDDVAPELTMKVTIGGAPVNGPVRLALDGSVTLTATVSPADAAVQIVLWEIADGGVAGPGQSGSTMTTENPFVVTARNLGETTITVTAIIGGAGSVTAGITVRVRACAYCENVSASCACGSNCDCATEGACGLDCSCHAPDDNFFVRVRGGTFLMGSPEGTPNSSANERPVREVRLSDFYISRFQVTQGEWYDVMQHLPSGTADGTRRPSFFNGTNDRFGATVTPTFEWRNLPVERVSWFEAVEFANRKSLRSGLTPAYTISGINVTWNRAANGYRLPTEFAARGGIACEGNYAFSGSGVAAEVAWHSANSGSRTHEVGRLAPNALGLYDMSVHTSSPILP